MTYKLLTIAAASEKLAAQQISQAAEKWGWPAEDRPVYFAIWRGQSTHKDSGYIDSISIRTRSTDLEFDTNGPCGLESLDALLAYARERKSRKINGLCVNTVDDFDIKLVANSSEFKVIRKIADLISHNDSERVDQVQVVAVVWKSHEAEDKFYGY